MAVFSNVFLGMQIPLSSYLQVFFSVFSDVFMSLALMYESSESNLMQRKPRNAKTDHLADWRFFVQLYLFIGLMMWPCAMGMWFYYFKEAADMNFGDLMFAFNNWGDGYKGYTIEQLNQFVSVGQCC